MPGSLPSSWIEAPKTWVVTGAAGFIGSHLVQTLLESGQIVVGVDNLRTGRKENLADVKEAVGATAWRRFRWIEGDILGREVLAGAFEGSQVVLHQAAIGSVPASFADPAATHAVNVTGSLEVLLAARTAGVSRVVFASSSAVYGDATDQPAIEGRIGRPLSPYAISKRVVEEYAEFFDRGLGLACVGLRYFNVFGPRQDPAGAYAAVIPRWIEAMLEGRDVEIFGDGRTTRDFCPVENVVHANLLAASRALPAGTPRVFNVGLGQSTRLSELQAMLARSARELAPRSAPSRVLFREERGGDVRHSQADLTGIRRALGYEPVLSMEEGLGRTFGWYARRA